MRLLFEEKFDGVLLFKNQLDLVTEFLDNPASAYYIEHSDKEEYFRAQSRLKAYVSQLLSSSVSRNLTEDFKNTLHLSIAKRLKSVKENPRLIAEKIISDLVEKNSVSVRLEPKRFTSDQLLTDLNYARYVAIITSKPLEVEERFDSKEISVQRFIILDLIRSLREPGRQLKYYRFNFPLESFCTLLWKGLIKILYVYIKENIHSSDFKEALYSNYFIKTKTLTSLQQKTEISQTDVLKVVDEILNFLNRNRYLMVFLVRSPIYTMPLIAIDPNEGKNAKLYSILENDNQRTTIHRYSSEDLLLWRLFVWDEVKTKNAGTEIKYNTAI